MHIAKTIGRIFRTEAGVLRPRKRNSGLALIRTPMRGKSASNGRTAQTAYGSDNTDVIVVDENSLVTAAGQGEATVTMTVSGSNGGA